ncbi:MAG: hypothetical protein MJ180_00990 [Candidatus Gastranaerophilales bacterium]|nr:hypothetical protein [Candidatus Gastranaerophilales bacterium]
MAGNFFAKAIGLAAVGTVACDVAATTREQAPKYAKRLRVEQLNDIYMGSSGLDTTSVVGSKLHKMIRRWNLDNNPFRTRQNIVSYVKCFCRNLTDNGITLGLGAIALFTGTGKFSLVKVPVLNKVAAALLAIKGCSFVFKNVLGFGADDFRRNVMK